LPQVSLSILSINPQYVAIGMLKQKFLGQHRAYYRNMRFTGKQAQHFSLSHPAAAHNYTGSCLQIKTYGIK
jgi:hypothetical protein